MFPLLQVHALDAGFLVQFHEGEEDVNEIKDRAVFCKDFKSIVDILEKAVAGVDRIKEIQDSPE